jgi:hypothetical protein
MRMAPIIGSVVWILKTSLQFRHSEPCFIIVLLKCLSQSLQTSGLGLRGETNKEWKLGFSAFLKTTVEIRVVQSTSICSCLLVEIATQTHVAWCDHARSSPKRLFSQDQTPLIAFLLALLSVTLSFTQLLSWSFPIGSFVGHSFPFRHDCRIALNLREPGSFNVFT